MDRNEDYPTAVTTAGDCEYKIKKCDEAICTVRLDFEQFNIDSWATTDAEESRICVDSFDVTVAPTTGLTIPSICGTNAGQHSKFYILEKPNRKLKMIFTCSVH